MYLITKVEEPMPEIVGVYNATGTLFGELTYIIKKGLGLSKCALCDITHGWQINGKKSWKDQCGASALEYRFLHLEELSEEQKYASSAFPTWIIYHQEQWIEVMTAHEISSFQNNPQAMIEMLENRVKHLYI